MGAFAGAAAGVADALREKIQREHQTNLLGMQIKQQNVQLQHQTNLEMSTIAGHLGDMSEDPDVKALWKQTQIDILNGKKVNLEDVTKQALTIHHANQARRQAQAQDRFQNPQSSTQPAISPPQANLPGPPTGISPPQAGPTGATAAPPSPAAAAPPAPPPATPAMNQPGGGMSASGAGTAAASGVLTPPPSIAGGPQFEPVQFPEQPLYPGEEYKERLRLAGAAQQKQDVAKIEFQAYKAKRDLAMGYAKQLMGQGVRHFMEGIDAQGNPTFRADQGRWVPGFVYGSDDPNAPDKEKIYRVKEYTDGTKEYVAEKGRPLTTVVRDASSPLGAWKNIYAQNGEFISRVAVEPPAALQPTTTTRTGEQITDVYNPNTGQVEKRKVPVSATTVRTKGGAAAAPPLLTPPGKAGTSAPVTAAPAPPRGGVVGTSPRRGPDVLPPQARLAAEKNLGAVNNAISILERIGQNTDLLTGIISAKKIQLQADPNTGILKGAINRAVPMTPQEQQLAADFLMAKEHINVLRQPLGAAGFRSKEAWTALTAMAGNPMADPKVTKRVIGTTLTALYTQRGVIQASLNRGTGTQQLIPPPTAGGTIETWERGSDGKLRKSAVQ